MYPVVYLFCLNAFMLVICMLCSYYTSLITLHEYAHCFPNTVLDAFAHLYIEIWIAEQLEQKEN